MKKSVIKSFELQLTLFLAAVFMLMLIPTGCNTPNTIPESNTPLAAVEEDAESNTEEAMQNNYDIMDIDINIDTVEQPLWPPTLISDNPSKKGLFWLGMTIEEAAQAFKDYGLVTFLPETYDYDEFGSWAISEPNQRIMSTVGLEGHWFTFVDGKLAIISFMPQPHVSDEDLAVGDDIKFFTEKGLYIGDSFDKVEELYGQPLRVENEDDRRIVGYYYMLGDKYYLIVQANGAEDVVDAIFYSIYESSYIPW
jgi:hypothetical protein